MEFVQYYYRIANPATRKNIFEIAETMSEARGIVESVSPSVAPHPLIDNLNTAIDHVIGFVSSGCHASVVWKDANLGADCEGREQRRVFDKDLAVFLMDAIDPQTTKWGPAQVSNLPKARIKI